MTPEGRVKAAIDRVLDQLKKEGVPLYTHKPVQNGMGAPTLDYVGCSSGRYFAIEAKAPGKKPTVRQVDTMAKIQQAYGVVFTIEDAIGIDMLVDWIKGKNA